MVLCPGQVHPRLIGYAPACLEHAEWERLGPSARALVTKAEPASDEEAKGLAGALCRLLADQLVDHPGGSLEQLLSDAAITRMVSRLRASSAVKVTTTQVLRSRLNRLLATSKDLPMPHVSCSQMRVQVQSDPRQVWARIARVDAAPQPVANVLRRRVALGAAAGLIGFAADRARVNVIGDTVGVRADDGSAPLVAPRYRQLLTTVEPGPHTDRLAWLRARDWWFARHGGWDDARLRDAWVAEVITLPVSAADLFAAQVIAYRAIDRIHPGPPGSRITAERDRLRG